jgi:hypothetical protein
VQTVHLYRNTRITSNTKMRRGLPPIAETIPNVQFGYISQANTGQQLQIELPRTYKQMFNVDMIKIDYEDIQIVGLVNEVTFVNFNNTILHFEVDYWTTSIANGYTVGTEGIISRATISEREQPSFINLMGEPFGISDIERPFFEGTTQLNNAIRDYEGGEMHYVLHVTHRVGNLLALWLQIPQNALDPTLTPRIVDIGSYEFPANVGMGFMGGEATPTWMYRFSNKGTLLSFINGLNGMVFMRYDQFDTSVFDIDIVYKDTEFVIDDSYKPVGNLDIQLINLYKLNNPSMINENVKPIIVLTASLLQLAKLAVVTSAVIYQKISTTAQTNIEEVVNNASEIPILQFIFIGEADIIQINVLPVNLVDVGSGGINHKIPKEVIIDFHKIDNARGINEPTRNHKLLTYPYLYYKVVTQSGASITILPQKHFIRDGVWVNTGTCQFKLIYTGGLTPRLLMQVSTQPQNGRGLDNEMILLREYPTLSLSIDPNAVTTRKMAIKNNIYMQNISANVRQSTGYTMRRGGVRVVQGGISGATQGGLFTRSKTGGVIGGIGGAVSEIINAGYNAMDGVHNASMEASNHMRGQSVDQVGSFSSPPSILTGADGEWLLKPDYNIINIYTCGVSNGEHNGMDDLMDKFGQSINQKGNHLTTTLWQGLATVAPKNGRTYMQFDGVEITGVPTRFIGYIEDLLHGGVWWLD